MKEKIKTIIVEDEKLARDLLKNYLKGHAEIELVEECTDGFSGIKAIQQHQPDLVFLDIQMPKLTGFEMLELLDYTPCIIFTTAYDQYAIKAFEHNAIDYLLKPFSKERLALALEKAHERMENQQKESEKIKMLSENTMEEYLQRVVVKSGQKIHVFPVEQIRFLESQDDYVMIYTHDHKYLKQKTMHFFETHLDPSLFVRIHRSYIVNVEQIMQLEPYEKDSYVCVIKDHTKLKVSQSGLKVLKQRLHF
jgi:two-component system, LytTR family, response regulator